MDTHTVSQCRGVHTVDTHTVSQCRGVHTVSQCRGGTLGCMEETMLMLTLNTGLCPSIHLRLGSATSEES